MKGVFLVQEILDMGKLTGPQKKVLSQIRAFNQSGMNCEMKCIPRGDERCGLVLAGLVSLFPGMNLLPIWGKAEDYKEYDYMYLRRPTAMSYAMRKFLRKLKKINPNIKIVMEIPTYPYDGEMKAITRKPFLWKDRYNRKKLSGLVDALAVVSADSVMEDIWGLPTIPFKNGYDVHSVEVAGRESDRDSINLCCAARFHSWHGYERLLLGMEKYYKNGGDRKVFCHMIGDGDKSEMTKYEKIAESKYLRDKVIFHGWLSGQKLDALYNQMDIGVCSLGMHKIKGLEGAASVLKSREFMAKGLPMITACEVDVFQGKDIDFVCEFENNDSILDVSKIIIFYDNIRKDDGLRERIREFALQTVDIYKTMQPIMGYMRSGRVKEE